MSKLSASKRQVCALSVIATVGIALVVVAMANRGTMSRASSPYLASQPKSITPSARGRYQAAFASLPLAFERNQGQADPQVKYLARANGYNLFLTDNDAVFAFRPSHPKSSVSEVSRHHHGPAFPDSGDGQKSAQTVVHMRFEGGNGEAQTITEQQLPGTTNYYLGNDPKNWHSNISQYGRVVYKSVYPGINLAYYGDQRKLEFDFIVAPQSDPTPIDLAFNGAQKLTTNASGDLIVSSGAGEVVLRKPVAYQQQGGTRQSVEARFVLKADKQVSFELGSYDRSRELVIDPSLTYGTYLGGASQDEVLGIAVDNANNIYVTGQTNSTSGWLGSPTGTVNSGYFDAFVTKLDSTGALTYTTFVGGGTGNNSGRAIAVDSSQAAYVTGITQSVSFPATGPQPVSGSSGSCAVVNSATGVCTDAFAFKLSANGQTLSWATYIGGDNDDDGYAIAVDSSGNTWVGGDTFSADFFSHVNAVATIYTKFNNDNGPTPPPNDGFVVEINPTGTSFLFGTYLGGSFGDQVNAIAVDSSGNAYAAGETNSNDFPTTPGVYKKTCGSDGLCNISGGIAYYDGFVTKITPGATALTYSTYIGGSSDDYAYGIAVDSLGDAYITGETTKDDTATTPAVPYPSTAGAYSTTYNAAASSNAFVTELNPTGTAPMLYSTFLGGSTADIGGGIAVDGAKNAYVTGMTQSSDFPLKNPVQSQLNGNGSTTHSDAFVTQVLAGGATLGFSTYLGGSLDENASPSPALGSIALDGSNNIWVGGSTDSTNFPPAGTPAQPGFGGGAYDGFIAEYSATTAADFGISATELVPATVAQGGSATSTVTITPLNGFTGTVALSCSDTPSSVSPPLCTFSPSSTVTGGSGTVTMTISTTSTTTLGTYEIAVKGTGPSTNHSASLSLGVSVPNFSITATTPPAVAPGTSGMSTVTLTSIAGYSSSVHLSCAVTGGTGTLTPVCTVTGTNPVTPTASGKTSAVTISTTAPPGAGSRPRKFSSTAMWLPIAGLAFVGMGFTTTRSRRKKLFGFLILGMVMTALFLMPACGGGGSSTGGGGTCAAAPSVPTGLAASSTTSSGATLTWTASTAGANCSVSSYTVYQGTGTQAGTSIGTATTPTFSVTGLSPSSAYNFTVAATDSAGTSAQSSPPVSVMTLSAGTPAANYTVTITAVGSDINATTHTAVITMTVN